MVQMLVQREKLCNFVGVIQNGRCSQPYEVQFHISPSRN